MSWLQIRQNPTNCDPKACYDSFCIHWQQAYEIILKADPQKPPTHDDVLGVVSHLDYMVTLLLVELHNCNKISLPSSTNINLQQPPAAPCLEYLLSENLLDKLYEWGTKTGRYANAVRLEQLKLYELLVSHSRHQLLVHEPFLRPLLKILASSQGEIFPPDIEKRLVLLLNQLCVVLMQNVHLLDLFFFSSNQQHGNGQGKSDFILFSLLIPFVHRKGSLGHQARDALLLCMSLSQKNSNIGTYIAQYSSMCPLLVAGLGGLYSRLPNTIEINSIDWHRITPDDVNELPELSLFLNSLEFCNAVVQVAHDLIKQQLLDFIYQGFIVPVLGPSILQTNIESQISATAYLDLIIRSVTEPGLLKVFIKFLLDDEKFDGQRILDVLVERLNSTDPNLCMVMLSFFDTILSLYCEDILLELFLKYLLPGKHVPISYRHKINRIDPYVNTIDFFLNLTPDIMKHSANIQTLRKQQTINNNSSSSSIISQQSVATTTIAAATSLFSKTIGANWNHYGLHSGDSLYSNYHAYLFDAHQKITKCYFACQKWSDLYKYNKINKKIVNNNNSNQLPEKAIELVRNFLQEFPVPSTPVTTSTNCLVDAHLLDSDKNKFDSLQSTGESSGYESFKWRPEDEFDAVVIGSSHPHHNELSSANNSDIDNIQKKLEPSWKISSKKESSMIDLDFSEDIFAQGTVSLASTGLAQIYSFFSGSSSALSHFSFSSSFNNNNSSNNNNPMAATSSSSSVINIPLRETNNNNNNNSNNNAISNSPNSIGNIIKSSSSSSSNNSTTTITLGGGNVSSSGIGVSTGGSEPSSLDSLSSMTSTIGAIASTSGTDRSRDLALCAVLLDEWLKELAAISEEQSIVMLNFCN